jgi:hypothetical protein
MRYKGTLILLVLVVLLGLYLYAVELPSQKAKQQEEEKSQRMASFKPDEAVGLFLSYPHRPADQEILLEKNSENKWQIVKPIVFPADQSEVYNLLSSMESMKAERVVEEKAQDLKVYGLDQPEIQVSVRLKDQEEHLLFGDSAPVGSTIYVMRSGEDIVRLTDQFHKTRLTKTVADLRKKEVLDLDPQRVTQLILEYPGQTFALAKEGGRWWIKSPSVLRADDEVISDMVGFLGRLRAKDFVDQASSVLLKSFQHPRVKVDIESENGTAATLSIYDVLPSSQDKRRTYAVTSTSHTIYLIEDKAVTDLEKDIFTLGDKHLLAFDPEQVKVVEIKKASDEVLVIRREDNGWSLESQIIEGSMQPTITDFLRDLSELKADQVVEETPQSENPYGLNPPQFKINLIDSQQKRLAELLIGTPKNDHVYARSGLSGNIYMVRSRILEGLPQKSDLKKQATQK